MRSVQDNNNYDQQGGEDPDHIYTHDRINAYGYRTFSRTKDEFITFYENELVEQMEELEIERIAYWTKLKKRLMIGVIGLLILLPIFIKDGMETYLKIIIYFNICIFTLGYFAVQFMNGQKVIESKMKTYIVPCLVKFMNPNFTYEPEALMKKQDFNDALIFKNKADSFIGDDLIEGFVYDEAEQARTSVSFSEIGALNTYKRRTAKGKKVKPTGLLLLGQFFKVDFNKDFGNSVTIIKPRWLLKKKKYRKKLAIYGGKESPLQEVKLENREFMKRFIVHSNDQINARVILQADTMQNLLDFVEYQSETISGRPAKKRKRKHYIPYFSFRRNQIYLLLHTQRNHFNVELFRKITIETAYNYFKDINRVLRLIDDLNLNLDLYKK